MCIKPGSWGVAGGQDPDMLHGTRWVAGIFCYDLQMQLRVVGHDAVHSPMSTAEARGTLSFPVWGDVLTLFSTMSSCVRRVGPFKNLGLGRKKNSNGREAGVFRIGSGIHEAVRARTVRAVVVRSE